LVCAGVTSMGWFADGPLSSDSSVICVLLFQFSPNLADRLLDSGEHEGGLKWEATDSKEGDGSCHWKTGRTACNRSTDSITVRKACRTASPGAWGAGCARVTSTAGASASSAAGRRIARTGTNRATFRIVCCALMNASSFTRACCAGTLDAAVLFAFA
jgi:hypothetical protein